MKKKIMPYVRVAGFMICLLLMIGFANQFLLQTDTVVFLTFREMQEREDIELAVVGSSVVRDHFDPALISERTGKIAYNVSAPAANFQAQYAMTEELFRTNSPEWVVAVVEPYSLNNSREMFETQYKLMPMLTDIKTRLRYYLTLSMEDGMYLDRLLLFRTQMASSLGEVGKTFGLWLNPEKTFEKVRENLEEGVTYMGQGFLRYDVEPMTDEYMRHRIGRMEPTRWEWKYPLLDATQERLLAYKALCEENGAKLLLMVHPMHTSYLLYHPDYIRYNASLLEFCAENGIACYSFIYAKPEFYPCLDEYYFDFDHMNAEGARIFSEAFAEFFNLYAAGEDVSGLFYANQYEYLDRIDFITNCWVIPTAEGVFEADCLRTETMSVEYRFVLRDAGGHETLLRDYSEESVIEVQIPEGCDLRVYARVRGKEQESHVYYSYPSDYVAYYGETISFSNEAE